MINTTIHATLNGNGSDQTLYTVASGKWGWVTEIVVVNTTGSPQTFNIKTQPNGGTAVHYGGKDIPISTLAQVRLVPDPQSLRLADQSAVIFNAPSGVEATLCAVEVT